MDVLLGVIAFVTTAFVGALVGACVNEWATTRPRTTTYPVRECPSGDLLVKRADGTSYRMQLWRMPGSEEVPYLIGAVLPGEVESLDLVTGAVYRPSADGVWVRVSSEPGHPRGEWGDS